MNKSKKHADELDAALAALHQPASPIAAVEPSIGVEEPDENERQQEMMAEVGGAPAPDRTIAELAAAAKSSSDFLTVLSRINRDAEEAEAHLAQLEAGRASIILDGKDVGEFHRELFVAKQTIVSLKAAEKAVQERYASAIGDEERSRIERLAAATTKINLPGYRAALTQFHKLMEQLVAAAKVVDQHEAALADLNADAERAGRADLRISISRARQDVVVALGAKVIEAPVVERSEGESDEAFDLRRGNAHALVLSTLRNTDPLRLAGDAAIGAITELAYEMDPTERSRNRRLIDKVSFRTYHGGAGLALRDAANASGEGVSGVAPKPQAGPYGKHGVVNRPASDPGMANLGFR